MMKCFNCAPFLNCKTMLVLNPITLPYLKHGIQQVPVPDFCVYGRDGGDGGRAALGVGHHQRGAGQAAGLGGHRDIESSTDPSRQSRGRELV